MVSRRMNTLILSAVFLCIAPVLSIGAARAESDDGTLSTDARVSILKHIRGLEFFRVDAMSVDSDEDSLKSKLQLREERRRLRARVDSLTDQNDALTDSLETAGTERRTAIETEIEHNRQEIELGNRDIERISNEIAGAPDGDDWEEEEFSDFSIFDENSEETEDEFRFGSEFLRRYRNTYPLLFPLRTELGETIIRYNRVEGVYLGIAQPKRVYWHKRPVVIGTGSLGYGFASHRWRYSLGLYLPAYFEDHILEIGGEGHSFTDSKDQWMISRDENSAMAFFAREDFLDYFGREGFSATATWYMRNSDFMNISTSVAYVHDTYENLAKRTNWSLFGGDKKFRPGYTINDGNLNSVVLSAALHTLTTMEKMMEGWQIQVLLEKGGGFTKGDFDFSQAIVDVRRYQPLAEFLNVNVRFRGGTSDGTVPRQRSLELGGISTLPGYRYKEFAGTTAMLVNLELILRSSFARKAHGWVSSLLSGTNLILFADAGAVNAPETLVTRDVLNGSLTSGGSLGDWKSDAGVAVGSADGDFRIGVAWRLDRAESPNFILRFSRPF